MSPTIWFTSDLHLGHARLLEFCRNTRRGNTIEEHDALLIESWNSVVKRGDIVYILGDECLGDRDVGYKNISKLNGSKHLIRGNHTQLKKEEHKALFQSISDYKSISVKRGDGTKQQIILCHYPIISWHNMHHGSWMVHGHCHGGLKDFGGKMFDCGIDNRKDDKMLPFSYEEIDVIMTTKDILKTDGHH